MNKKVGIGLGIVIFFSVCFLGYQFYQNQRDYLQFKEAKLEIGEELDGYTYIKEMDRCEKEDIQIDTSKVQSDKLGIYDVIYKVHDKEYTLKLEVVDTQKPTFDIQDIDVDLGTKVSTESFVSNIKDATKTKVSFKEDYNFDQSMDQDVTLIVEDEAGNKTEKQAHVKIVKDTQKPTLSGLKDLTVQKNGKINYLQGVVAKDNRDPKPQITVEDQRVNLSQAGVYEVTYVVKDRSNNINRYVQKVTVKEMGAVQSIGQSSKKVVYLTFDDGPSPLTQEVLDVLDQYSAKATFFVTGNNQKYNYLIKKAHDKGHTIGLHTYSHDYKRVYASENAYFADLDKIGQMVKKEIGYVPTFIRFPGGSSNAVSKKYNRGIMSRLVREVQARGYQYYDWNVSSGDASSKKPSASRIVKNSTQSHANNIVLLAHDIASKDTTVEALPQIIEHYQKLGYTFEGLNENSFTPHHGVNN